MAREFGMVAGDRGASEFWIELTKIKILKLLKTMLLTGQFYQLYLSKVGRSLCRCEYGRQVYVFVIRVST